MIHTGPESALRLRVEEPRQETPATGARYLGQLPERFGLDHQTQGKRRTLDEVGMATIRRAVNTQGVTGVTFEVHVQVGEVLVTVPSAHHADNPALGAHDGHDVVVLSQEGRQPLRCGIVREKTGRGRNRLHALPQFGHFRELRKPIWLFVRAGTFLR